MPGAKNASLETIVAISSEKGGITVVESRRADMGMGVETRILAKLPHFSANEGFSRNSGCYAAYFVENRAQNEQLKRTPR